MNPLGFRHFLFLAQQLFEWITSSDESLPETLQESLESQQTGSVNQTNGKTRAKRGSGCSEQGVRCTHRSRMTDRVLWGCVCLNFASLTALYYAEVTRDTIIKLRSQWIVHNDNSTFVIQLQINPLCSVLLHRFWYHSSILTAAYYCHTKMLPEP